MSLQIPAFKNKMVSVTISDITGRRISIVNAAFDANGRAILAMSHYVLPGLYLIEVYAEGRQYEAKVSIMNK
jgi:hypothetical protein